MPLTIDHAPLAMVVKNETSLLHQEVEDLLLPQLQQIRSLHHYARILQMFYGFYHPVQEAIFSRLTANELPDIEKRRTASLIVADLTTLGYPAPSAECSFVPEILNTQQAFGALYVLEGSTLGGKMIARMLEKNSHVAIPPNALSFFSSYRAETGPMWKGFLDVLNRQPDVAAIVRAANETFLSLKSRMETFYEATNEL